MRWLKQKVGINNCGQIALAVITNKSLKEIINLIGHNTYTKTKDLVSALRKLNYNCPNRLLTLKKKPELAIAKLTYPDTDSDWHWVVIYKTKIYDGRNGNKKGVVHWEKGCKITSYLPLEIKNKYTER